MKFVIGDDHPLFRYGFSLLLQALYDEEIDIIETPDYEALKDVLERADGIDVAFCDLLMPDRKEGAVRDVVERAGRTPVVVVSASEALPHIKAAYREGAKGYLFKGSSLEGLREAVATVTAGGIYIPPELLGNDGASNPAHSAIASYGRPERRADKPADRPNGPERENAPDYAALLTRREHEILGSLVRGVSNKLIARHLNLSEGTVKAHVRSIFRKMGVNNRTEAALRGAELAQRRAAEDIETLDRGRGGDEDEGVRPPCSPAMTRK